MKVINDILYIEFKEAVESGISGKYLRDAKSKGRKCWHFIDDPEDRRKVLIDYSKMREKYQNKVQEWLKQEVGCQHEGNCHCGDPYYYMSLEPIREMIVKDDKAEGFYFNYRYDGPTGVGMDSLDSKHVKKYTKQASLLNFLLYARKNKKEIKRRLGIRMDVFHEKIQELNELSHYGLPTSYSNLMKACKKYEKGGYESLIDWRFGNGLAKKVNDKISESLLLELIAHPNQFDDVYISDAYNEWAADNNYKTIDRATVGVWRRKKEHLIMGMREGNTAWYDRYGKIIKGHRPSYPLYESEHDDNHIDLQFIDPEGKGSSKYHHRYIAIVVIDSFNDYVLGYAYAENVSAQLVRAAWLNAMHHIHDLTGCWYLPHELKTDNWGKGTLIDYYRDIAKYQESPNGSKRGRGYIEQFFGSSLWKNSLKIGANNYTGNNMTAKTSGVNKEMVDKNKPFRPTLLESHSQIDSFFNRLRTTKIKETGMSKQEQWLDAWCNMPDSEKRVISEEQFLSKFGIHHKIKNGNRNKITNGGIETSINKVSYHYTVPPALYLHNVGKKVDLYYDPFDMSRIYVTDHERLRFVATKTKLMPRAMKDHHQGSRTALNALLAEKEADAKKVGDAADSRRKTLREQGIDPMAVIASGTLQKELYQQATIEAEYEEERDEDSIYNKM